MGGAVGSLEFAVTESMLPKGWNLLDIQCEENLLREGTDNTTWSVEDRTAVLLVDPGETVNCEFINQVRTVPAMPAWALLALLVMLGVGGLSYLRRQAVS